MFHIYIKICKEKPKFKIKNNLFSGSGLIRPMKPELIKTQTLRS